MFGNFNSYCGCANILYVIICKIPIFYNGNDVVS